MVDLFTMIDEIFYYFLTDYRKLLVILSYMHDFPFVYIKHQNTSKNSTTSFTHSVDGAEKVKALEPPSYLSMYWDIVFILDGSCRSYKPSNIHE